MSHRGRKRAEFVGDVDLTKIRLANSELQNAQSSVDLARAHLALAEARLREVNAQAVAVVAPIYKRLQIGEQDSVVLATGAIQRGTVVPPNGAGHASPD